MSHRSILPFLPITLWLLTATSPAVPSRASDDWSPPTPQGFTASKPVERYGTLTEPLQNGNIYDYMDGGGEVYLKHGLRSLTHGVWQNRSGVGLSLDRFTFSSPDQADRALVDDDICPPGHTPLTLARVSVRSYAFSPEYFLYFSRGPHLYYLYVSDDRQKEVLNAFAERLIREIGPTGEQP